MTRGFNFEDMVRLAVDDGRTPLSESRTPRQRYDALTERVATSRILPSSDWGLIDVLTGASASLSRCLRGVRNELEGIAFQEPELEEVSLKLRDGAVAELEDLTGRVGHSLGGWFDSACDSGSREERFTIRGPLATQAIALSGEVARLQTLAKECLPTLKKKGADGDFAVATEALEKFLAKSGPTLDKIRTGVTSVATAFVKLNT